MVSLSERLKNFSEGTEERAWEILGCHFVKRENRQGYCFRVWAPNAERISVVGDFNFWNEDDLEMSPIGCGVWEAFSPYAREGQNYKFCITGKDGVRRHKIDLYGRQFAALPEQSAVIASETEYGWHDSAFLRKNAKDGTLDRPVNIYELHAGSWKVHDDGTAYSYEDLAEELVPYVKDMGYTHIELMPICEYPYVGSWGYQVTGYYAPTFRYGTPEGLKKLIDRCHQAGLGVILDWVPAHFPKDAHGLYEYDGSCCYELSDPMMNEHPDWTTRIFDFGKGGVRSFLVSNAVFWLEHYHIDGIRVDAVASMLYLDYNRRNFKPNRYGGRENLEAIAFLQAVNRAAFRVRADAMMIAEESTAFPMITKPDYDGGLGFLYKWNMGWMNDMLMYMSQDPLFRKGCHHALTFTMTYAFSENFILPLSHDEVVHGKKSLVDKMPGSYDEKFSNLRAFYGFMMAHPGKKLNFMGNEFAQFIEWNYQQGLDWLLLDYDRHRQMHLYVRTLNRFYLQTKALWENDRDWDGFRWLQPDDCDNSVVAFRRIDRHGREVLAVCNFCPVRRDNYALGLDRAGWYVPVLNSDDKSFGGGGCPVFTVKGRKKTQSGHPYSGTFTLPPLSTVFYRRYSRNPEEKTEK